MRVGAQMFVWGVARRGLAAPSDDVGSHVKVFILLVARDGVRSVASASDHGRWVRAHEGAIHPAAVVRSTLEMGRPKNVLSSVEEAERRRRKPIASVSSGVEKISNSE